MEVKLLSSEEMKKYKTYMSMKRFLVESDPRNTLIYAAYDDEGKEIGRALLLTQGATVRLKYITLKNEGDEQDADAHFLTAILFDLRKREYRYFEMEYFESENAFLSEVAKKLQMEIQKTGRMIYNATLSDFSTLSIPDSKKMEMEKLGICTLDDLSGEMTETLGLSIDECEYAPSASPLKSMAIEKRISPVHVENGKPDGAIIVERSKNGLYISFMWVDSENSFLLEQLIFTVVTLANKNYDKETPIGMAVIDEKVGAFIETEFKLKGEEECLAEFDLSTLDEFL